MSADFFVSYNRADKIWAEWIAWQLEVAGYKVVLQAWDFRPGCNFVLEMQKAATEAERTIMVLSPDYLDSCFTQPEWAAAFARDPTGEKRKLLPVRVRECNLQGMLSQITYINLVDLAKTEAKEALLNGVCEGRAKPPTEPDFPGFLQRTVSQQPQFPGGLPPLNYPIAIEAPGIHLTVQENPFHTHGPLPINSLSYVVRQCEKELSNLIEENPLITVYGAYEIGKSSLLARMQTLLHGDWNILIGNLDGMRTDNGEVFIREFFKMVAQCFGAISSWEDIVACLQRKRSIFVLDEFGALSSTAVGAFIPKLFWLIEKVGKQTRVIVTLPEPIHTFFRSRGLENPKFLRNWSSLQIPPLGEQEVQALLRLLPEPAAGLASRHLNEIVKLSLGHPRNVQCLCSKLFELTRSGRSREELLKTIRNEENYR